MTKKELVTKVAERLGETQAQVSAALEEFLGVMGATLAGNEAVVLRGFGTFKIKERAARTGRNPNTGDPLNIPAKKKIVFSPASVIIDELNS